MKEYCESKYKGFLALIDEHTRLRLGLLAILFMAVLFTGSFFLIHANNKSKVEFNFKEGLKIEGGCDCNLIKKIK